MTETFEDFARYSRQMLVPNMGVAAQQRLQRSRALVLGVGALGTALASGLVRAGVGHVRLVDRDFIELHNLQRQTLFDEEDIAANLPKAIAAAQKLRKINGSVTVEPVVADVTHRNIENLMQNGAFWSSEWPCWGAPVTSMVPRIRQWPGPHQRVQ